ncbi:MAG: lysylphosphatidylglycerol synthase transmembrane domain-containing protein [Candidatus Nanoarchaeia archaeon]
MKNSKIQDTKEIPQTNSKLTLKNIIGLLVLIVLLFLFVFYIIKNINEFKSLSFVSPGYILIMIAISGVIIILNAYILKYLLEPFKIKLKFKEYFGLTVITSFYNTILPLRGGLFAKAAYLNKKHSFEISGFVAIMAGIYIINFFVAGAFGLIALFLIHRLFDIFNIIVFLGFLSCFLVSGFIIIFSPKFPETKIPFLNTIIKVINGWHSIKSNKKIVLIVFIISSLQLLMGTFFAYFAYQVFGVNIGLAKALLISSIGPLLVVIGITPSGLGINEAVSVFLAISIGISAVESIAVAVISRFASIIISFILGPIYSFILLKHNTDKKKIK